MNELSVRTGERYEPLLRVFNSLHRRLGPRPAAPLPTVDPGLIATRRQAAEHPSDISDHLETLYLQTVLARPEVIVELGVRGGESTRVLLRAAATTDATLISVDVEPAATVQHSDRWRFEQADSVEFGRSYPHYARANGLPERVDVLFLDTSHLYDDTVAELTVWLPLIRSGGVVLLHDTRMRLVYRRRDGSLGYGWDNERGVVGAVEHVLGGTIDETRAGSGSLGAGWFYAHDPFCSGLTILRCPHGEGV
ncbi:class I SAM-dependent methyltransferase [Saccharomonospora azurea]|uniref:class I SAM-dependent methyltransferase n=1 Tax=Saccharomonospora azurea TaxID=40988 RepID=UPI003D8D265F